MPICRAARGFSRSIGHRSSRRGRPSMHRRRRGAAAARDGAAAPEYLRSFSMQIWTACAGVVRFAGTTVSFAAGRERFGITATSKSDGSAGGPRGLSSHWRLFTCVHGAQGRLNHRCGYRPLARRHSVCCRRRPLAGLCTRPAVAGWWPSGRGARLHEWPL